MIRDILKELDVDEVKADIHAQGFSVTNVRIVHNPRDKFPLDLLMTELDLISEG